MEMKLIFAGAMFLAGWLWTYFFVRQLLFNLRVAYPLMRKMKALKEDLIAVGGTRYTNISMLVCILVSAILLFVIFRFCKLYLSLTFLGGALIAFLMIVRKICPENRDMFDSFCATYYQFVPDDELRTAMFNKKTGPIKARLKDMELEGSFIPVFDPARSTAKKES